jgi:D-inositol-3-phosphate glycosyltransferase
MPHDSPARASRRTRAKVFGTFIAAFEFDELDRVPGADLYGMEIFARRFIAALLRFSDFDEFHFFNRGSSRTAEPGSLLGSDGRVRLLALHDFEDALDQHDYHVFHDLWAPDIGPWTDVRNRFSRRNIPITGLTHSISYQSFLPRVLGTMLLGMRPWDSVICTAEPARTVMRNWIEHVQRELSATWGAAVRFDGRLDKIPLGVDTEQFCPRDKTPARLAIQLPTDGVVALYVGRFSQHDKMDLHPLLLAFKRTLERISSPRVTLLLAGAESFHRYAQAVEDFAAELGIASQVIVRTNLDDGALRDAYAAADLFVSPSDNLQETFGQSIIEAMSSGLPVVCSDWDGYKDLVVHERTGYRVPTYWMECDKPIADYAGLSEWRRDLFCLSQSVSVDVPEMSRAIERLALNADLRRQWGDEGRRRVLAHYDWRVVVPQYLALWEALNQIASDAPAPTPQPSSWFRAGMFKTFQHYSTALVGPATRVRSNARRTFQWHAGLERLIRQEVLEAIRDNVGREAAVGDLEEKVRRAVDVSADGFRFHLLWLLKYDHLTIDPATLELRR